MRTLAMKPGRRRDESSGLGPAMRKAAPYLGLGPAAHSFKAAKRWWNVRSVKEYCRRLAEGERPVESEEVLDARDMQLEALALGLRTRKGFTYSGGKNNAMLERAKILEQEGFLKIEALRFISTKKGTLTRSTSILVLHQETM